MGDVAMTVPVIKEVLRDNKDLHITMVSREEFKVFFYGVDRLKYIVPNLNEEHKGFWGLRRLVKKLSHETTFDAVVDLHGVLRSRVISFLFRIKGVKIARINKGRSEKHNLTKKNNKELVQLKQTTERYADVFRELGLKVNLSHKLPKKLPTQIPLNIQKTVGAKAGEWIGIAPFAQYTGKVYGFDKIGELISMLQNVYPKSKIFLFGGGELEIKKLKNLWDKYPQTILTAGEMTLLSQLSLMSNLDVMISMDSANMHMASLVGTKVVSVWGATHPYTGFIGYGQSNEWAAQIDDLECRPCSVFGDKRCYKGDYACMENLPCKVIVDKLGLIIPREIREEVQ